MMRCPSQHRCSALFSFDAVVVCPCLGGRCIRGAVDGLERRALALRSSAVGARLLEDILRWGAADLFQDAQPRRATGESADAEGQAAEEPADAKPAGAEPEAAEAEEAKVADAGLAGVEPAEGKPAEAKPGAEHPPTKADGVADPASRVSGARTAAAVPAESAADTANAMEVDGAEGVDGVVSQC
jgi:hypothetical protein